MCTVQVCEISIAYNMCKDKASPYGCVAVHRLGQAVRMHAPPAVDHLRPFLCARCDEATCFEKATPSRKIAGETASSGVLSTRGSSVETSWCVMAVTLKTRKRSHNRVTVYQLHPVGHVSHEVSQICRARPCVQAYHRSHTKLRACRSSCRQKPQGGSR